MKGTWSIVMLISGALSAAGCGGSELMPDSQSREGAMKRLVLLFLAAAAVLALLVPSGAVAAAGAPSLTFDPTAWDYGTLAPGATASHTFALKNSGGSATGALSVSITGSGAAAFTKTADSCSATSLGPNKSCSVTVAYSPSAASASDTATLTATSKKPSAGASASLTGQGTPANNPPFAADDSYTGFEDTAVNQNVLANDSDPDGDPLTAMLVSLPVNGNLTLNPNGAFVYTPNPNFHGVDSFTYQASDGTLVSNVATVTLQVVSVNDLPVANPDLFQIPESGGPFTFNLLANDTDVDGDPLGLLAFCNDLLVDTSGVSGDVASKLPGLHVTNLSGNVYPCLWYIITDDGRIAGVTLGVDGELVLTIPGASPFSGLDPGDVLFFHNTYIVGDGNGGADATTYDIAVNGS
jgi:Bacterial Ig domain/Cep192 domain 4